MKIKKKLSTKNTLKSFFKITLGVLRHTFALYKGTLDDKNLSLFFSEGLKNINRKFQLDSIKIEDGTVIVVFLY